MISKEQEFALELKRLKDSAAKKEQEMEFEAVSCKAGD